MGKYFKDYVYNTANDECTTIFRIEDKKEEKKEEKKDWRLI